MLQHNEDILLPVKCCNITHCFKGLGKDFRLKSLETKSSYTEHGKKYQVVLYKKPCVC